MPRTNAAPPSILSLPVPLAFVLSLAVLLAACGGSDGGAGVNATATDGGAGDAGSDGGTAAAARFSQVYSTILAVKCASCHTSTGRNPAGGLDMSTQALAYANLVDKVSTSPSVTVTPRPKRVDPSDSEHSLLHIKVTLPTTPDPQYGNRMPLNGTPLSAAEIGLITSWIDAGAAND